MTRPCSPLLHFPLLLPTVCLMVGMALEWSMDMPMAGLLWAAGVACLAAILASRWPLWQTVLIGLCCLLVGMVLAERREQAARSVVIPRQQPMVVVVSSEPAERPKTVMVEVIEVDNGQKWRCYLPKDSVTLGLQPCDGLSLRAQASLAERHDAYGRYLQVQGFAGQLMAHRGQWAPCATHLWWHRLSWWQQVRLRALRWRHHLLSRYQQQGITEQSYALLSAMTLGSKSGVTADVRHVFSVTGAAHVLALSGLHVGILYFLLAHLLVARRIRLWSQSLLIISLWGFALLTGLSPSLVRAATMLSVYALLATGGRGRMSVNVLCLTAIIMLVANPFSLIDVGFQLSFAAVLAILWWVPLLDGLVAASWLQRHRVARWLWGLTTVSIAAQMGVAPLLAYHFGHFSTYFLLSNYIVIPTATLILYGGLLALLFPCALWSHLLVAVVSALSAVLGLLARLPMASIDGLRPTVFQVMLCYVGMAALAIIVQRWQRRG